MEYKELSDLFGDCPDLYNRISTLARITAIGSTEFVRQAAYNALEVLFDKLPVDFIRISHEADGIVIYLSANGKTIPYYVCETPK